MLYGKDSASFKFKTDLKSLPSSGSTVSNEVIKAFFENGLEISTDTEIEKLEKTYVKIKDGTKRFLLLLKNGTVNVYALKRRKAPVDTTLRTVKRGEKRAMQEFTKVVDKFPNMTAEERREEREGFLESLRDRAEKKRGPILKAESRKIIAKLYGGKSKGGSRRGLPRTTRKNGQGRSKNC